MAKKAYVGVSNVARKVSKMYVGVNGVARKVKKAYVGVGGVARLFFQKGMDFNKIQIQTRYPLDEMASATNSNYVLFGGGETRAQGASSTTANTTVDAFNSSLTRTACTDLSVMRGSRGASSDNYAMIASQSSTVNIYNNSLSKQTVDISIAQSGAPGGDTLNHCVFGANTTNQGYGTMDKLACINKSTLTQTSATGLSYAWSTVFDPTVCSRFGEDWFCFGCGTGYIQHYDKNLTKQTDLSFSLYSSANIRMGVGTTNNYLICGGGSQDNTSGLINSTFAVDKNLTLTAASSLEVATSWFSACGNDDVCMFATGATRHLSGDWIGSINNNVYTYDDNLTRTTKHATNVGVWTYGAINFKDRLCLPNGRYSTNQTNYNTGVIDVWS